MARIEGFRVRNFRALRDITLGKPSTQQQAEPLTPFTVVVLDSDGRDCSAFLQELKALLQLCRPAPNALFRLAIEEMEAWYLGDRQAVLAAFPKAKKDVLARYEQDSLCGTWELLADAVHPGGFASIQKAGWPLPRQIKHRWAEQIGPRLSIEHNLSPSFCQFRDGIRRLVA